MTKQEFLDKEPNTNYEVIAQRLLVHSNKTKIAHYKRQLFDLYELIYKSEERAMPFTDIVSSVSLAYSYSQKSEE